MMATNATLKNILAAGCLLLSAAASAQTTGSRLLAQSHYNGSFASPGAFDAYDSVQYTYPGTTAAIQSGKLRYQYGGSAWVHMMKWSYTYNAGDKMTYMQYQVWGPGATAYTNGGQTFFFLNSEGFTTKDSNQLWLAGSAAYRNNVRNTYVLNAAGQVTDQRYDTWDAGASALLPYFHYVKTYNAQGKLTSDLLQDYDASIQWMDYRKSTYAYDMAGTGLQTITGQQRIGMTPGLQTTYQNVYALNATGAIDTETSNLYNSGTGTYGPSMRNIYTYDADGNNILTTGEQWDAGMGAYKPYQQYANTFNSYHQMTSQTRLFWNGTAYVVNSNSTRDNYYYESYSSGTTGVNNMAGESAELQLSPVPANSRLRILLNWKEAQAFTATVTDMSGRACHTFSAPAGKTYDTMLDVSSLPAGTYMLNARGEKGGSIARMLVVAH